MLVAAVIQRQCVCLLGALRGVGLEGERVGAVAGGLRDVEVAHVLGVLRPGLVLLTRLAQRLVLKQTRRITLRVRTCAQPLVLRAARSDEWSQAAMSVCLSSCLSVDHPPPYCRVLKGTR